MDIKYFATKARTSAINIAVDDVAEITVGNIKSLRSRIVSAGDDDSLELSEYCKAGAQFLWNSCISKRTETDPRQAFMLLSC